MVVTGRFSVSLVDAGNNDIVLKEHKKDGKIYVEASAPGDEYWIRVGVSKVEEWEDAVIVNIFVDGVDMGYNTLLTYPSTDLYGYWNNNVDCALQFKTVRKAQDNSDEDMSTSGVGTIVVKFYQGNFEDETESCTKRSSAKLDHVEAPADKGLTEKSVRSTKGKTKITSFGYTKDPGPPHGKLVKTITLHCCAAYDLVCLGVLEKWNISWDRAAKMSTADKSKVDPEIAKLEPKFVYEVTTVKVLGKTKVKKVRKEFFDLTHLGASSKKKEDDNESSIVRSWRTIRSDGERDEFES